MHPGTKDAPLAHHIIASANFDEIKEPDRDQTATRKALAELKMLVQRYPDSPYTQAGDNRIRLAEDMLAASEMNVGRYYLKRNNHVAAINRFKTVVTEYQTTRRSRRRCIASARPTWRSASSPEAQTAAAVLGHNFPNSEWYKHAYALLKSGGLSPQVSQGSWLTNAMKALTPGAAAEAGSRPAADSPRSPGQPSARGHAGADRVPSDVPTASTHRQAAAGLRPEQPAVAARTSADGAGILGLRGGSLAAHESCELRPTRPVGKLTEARSEGRARAPRRARSRTTTTLYYRARRARDLAMPTTTRCASAMRPSRRAFPSLCAPDSPSQARRRHARGGIRQGAPRRADAVARQRLRRRGRGRLHRPRAPLPGS